MEERVCTRVKENQLRTSTATKGERDIRSYAQHMRIRRERKREKNPKVIKTKINYRASYDWLAVSFNNNNKYEDVCR